MRKNPSSPTIRRRARELREEMTTAEMSLWEVLRARRFNNLKFRRQHPIGQFIVDFYCAEYKLVVEIDGPIHAEQVEHDQARTNFLNKSGYSVIRFSNDEVLNNEEAVLSAIACACR